MERWICTICQYVYDPETGDPDNGIPAGTPFESVPDTWACPLCGAGKDVFEKEQLYRRGDVNFAFPRLLPFVTVMPVPA